MRLKWVNIYKSFCTAGLFCILIITGCKKLVQVNEPADSLTTSAVFSNDSLAKAAIAGLYINVMRNTKSLLNGGMSLLPALSADELIRTTPMINEEQFYNNAIVSSNTLVYVNFWKPAYTYIYQCNICIEGLQKSTGVTAEVKRQLTGEVQFVRALCYYYLVNLFGSVPLALGTNADVNALLSRTPADRVYKQMETDLLAAGDALTANKPNTTPTKYATQALLARVYLYMRNWSKAEDLASGVINSGQFILENDLTKVFLATSPETIFQWVPVVDRINAAEGFIFVPAAPSLKPNYVLTDSLLNAFIPGDLRKANWIKTVTIGATTYNHPYKYRVFTSPDTPTEYNIVLRLAEQYLIRAESRAQQGHIEDAVVDLNVIRRRAGLPAIPTTIGSDECFNAIEQERRIELFAEWGHRWFDLKRTNRADVVLGATKGNNWQSNDRLYPIPPSELEADPNLVQNEGYN
jgi:hypothetical protein